LEPTFGGLFRLNTMVPIRRSSEPAPAPGPDLLGDSGVGVVVVVVVPADVLLTREKWEEPYSCYLLLRRSTKPSTHGQFFSFFFPRPPACMAFVFLLGYSPRCDPS